MYFPKLFNLLKLGSGTMYDADTLSYVDNFLGGLSQGTTFKESTFRKGLKNVFNAREILNDLIAQELIEINEEENELEEFNDDDSDTDSYYTLLVSPIKVIDEGYLEYRKNKRNLDSFSIIYERTKKRRSGALTLIDLKGYSRNMNNSDTKAFIVTLVDDIKKIIQDSLSKYFLNSYSGIEIKHNGDGWFLYFLHEHDAYEFLCSVIESCFNTFSVYSNLIQLGVSLKCYIHHSTEIEKIYKVDSMHFDMEGKDVILIHMLEKPIESKLYDGLISSTSSFIAVTENVIEKLGAGDQQFFKELEDTKFDIQDADGRNKVYDPNIKVFYKEIKLPESNGS